MICQRNYHVYMIRLNSLTLVCFYFHPVSIDRWLCLLFTKLINVACDTLADRNRFFDGKKRRNFKLIEIEEGRKTTICWQTVRNNTYLQVCDAILFHSIYFFFSHSIWNFRYCPWKSLSKLLINSNNKYWCRFKNSYKTTQLTAHKQKADTLQKNVECE